MRIIYIIDTLASKGGAERIISDKMNYLAAHDNYDVFVITCFQFPETTPNCYYLSDKVKQINLSIPSHLQYRYNYPIRLIEKWEYYRQLRRKVSENINSINPDIIIGVGYALADIVCRIKCRAAKIIESHEARPYTMSSVQYKQISLLSKVYLIIYRARYLNIIEKHADVVVTLTKEDAKQWKKAKQVEIIPNFSCMPITMQSNCEVKRVIAVGRLEWQKGYDRLLDIWALVTKEHQDWRLDIYGEGTLETELRNKIQESGLCNVSIHPYTQHISQEYAQSSICVLTSRYEGFSLVLLEAMRHGVPCISFNCPFGPEDLIDDKKCGYIVENGNTSLFANRLNELMKNANIRKSFSKAAIEKAKLYNKDTIMQQWETLFQTLN